MNASNAPTTKHVLEPVERISEVLFGLIMVLTITGSLSIAEAGRNDARTLWIGALGCNLAWGLIDGIMYLMGCLGERAQSLRTLRAIRNAPTAEAAHRAITAALPAVAASALQFPELERIRQLALEAPEPPSRPRLQSADWRGAVAVFLLVVLCTFPVVLPLMLLPDLSRAMRVSNAIAILLLFLCGYSFGRHAGYPPGTTGVAMVALGLLLVAITIALGGLNPVRRLPSLAALLPSVAAAMAAEPTRTALEVEAAAGVAQSPGPGAAVEGWEFSASVLTYIVPDGETYPQPTVTADRDHLHLEARYNYEALRTGSLWIGANLSAGERVAFEFTPMVGGVFGDLYGIAMGYESSLSWWRFELYSEGEYVVDARDSSGNFLYNWTELSISPVEWLRIGGVAQRTRAYDADRDIQRGVLVGVRHRRVSLTTYVFNPDHSDPLIVVAVGVAF